MILGISLPILFFALSWISLKKLKQWQEQRTRDHEEVFDVLNEGILKVDDQLRVLYLNNAACRILSISKRQALGKPLPTREGDLLLEKSVEKIRSSQRLRCILTDCIASEEGKKTHFDLIAIPRNGESIVIFQDTSSHYRILEMGKDFVASASHELRTPITIIRGFAETLQETKDLPQEMIESILEKVVRNCQRMETLVKNLLMLADIDSIPIPNYQPCDLGSLMEECLRVVRSVYPTAQIEVWQEGELNRVEVEPSLLELAILNLLGNAAKYSKAPAEIKIRMQKEGEEAKIVIQDRGIGIPSQDLDHIFERFYTVNKAHSRKLGGAGLGLSLVRTILEKHRGSIQVESILNEGSTFTVKIPLCQGARICT